MPDIDAARAVFDRFDLDGDGHVSAEELRGVVAELGEDLLSAEDARRLIDASDTNADGLLSFEEFWAARQAVRGS
ncbi:EF-hand domain-containing protein [Streptomyces sp. AJS327]|uniref:EF-hand domain-containing protein n=1 Tax=Streptomyces sp. AJS327 TaxID=2545265 RepID=UPI0015DF7522|nr:EF-hand domain-containing protein [Streptomyces sp. AJS327]MBA0051663.1 EF-hand domain-containing protein [Streptomyces sp. AJS327]